MRRLLLIVVVALVMAGCGPSEPKPLHLMTPHEKRENPELVMQSVAERILWAEAILQDLENQEADIIVGSLFAASNAYFEASSDLHYIRGFQQSVHYMDEYAGYLHVAAENLRDRHWDRFELALVKAAEQVEPMKAALSDDLLGYLLPANGSTG